MGRERFDVFLRAYFDASRFKDITTADFLEYIGRELPAKVALDEWIYRPGIPKGARRNRIPTFSRACGGGVAERHR